MLLKFVTIFCSVISLLHVLRTDAQDCPADKDKPWSYDLNYSNGPSHWKDKYPECNGKSQSPIDIDTKKVSEAKGPQKLKLNGYDTPITKLKIENNGHSIVITPKDNVKRSLEVDNVAFNLQSFHFHWGNDTSKGSEHEINGHKYTMEAHFVHKNNKDDLAVVGVFFKENYFKNTALDNILHVRNSYLYAEESFEGTIWQFSLNPFRWGRIYLEDLVDDNCSYYRYNGSLTTPPCSENVTWILCKRNKFVERSQMKQLFSLYSVKRGTQNEKKCHLVNNYRPIQPLNDRKVYASMVQDYNVKT